MFQRWSWFAVGMMMVVGAFSFAAHAQDAQKEPANSEAGLDLSLRSTAAVMPVVTLDGSAMESPASHMYLMDYDTGTALASKAANNKMYPSSMTKMMTLYIIFERLKDGTLSLTNQFTVNPTTWVNWNNKGSSMFLPINSQVTLEDLIRGIAIQSGNDACVVAAEGIAGSEEAFAKLMNEKAKAIGMGNSNFTDSTGWPHPEHTTTPHDLAVLGAALIHDFPQYYHYLSEREFTFHNIRQFNRNLLLANPSLKVDGLKTGHTDAAGYGITLSAKDPVTGRRVVLVVNGLDTDAARAQEGERLLKWGLLNFHNITAFKAGTGLLNANVWMGAQKEVPVTVAQNINITAPKAFKEVKGQATYNSPLVAPITRGQEVGKLAVTFSDGKTTEYPLVAAADVPKLGFFARSLRAIGL